MYITLLILPLLATGCGGRKETAQTMPVPEISVARPTVQNITLTKEYPGYLTSEKTVDLVGRVSGTFTDHRLRSRQPGTPGTSAFCHRTDSLSRQCAAGGSRTQHCRANLEYAQNN